MQEYENLLEKFTHRFVKWTVTSWGFSVAFGISILLIIAGLFLPPQTWGNLLTMVTGIGSFLMIFLMQRSQSKEFLALQVKVNELLSSHEGADNELINIENSSENRIKSIHAEHEKIK